MKHCKDCIHADKGHKEQPCADCAQINHEKHCVELTRWQPARSNRE